MSEWCIDCIISESSTQLPVSFPVLLGGQPHVTTAALFKAQPWASTDIYISERNTEAELCSFGPTLVAREYGMALRK
eukprot:s739_g18.t1